MLAVPRDCSQCQCLLCYRHACRRRRTLLLWHQVPPTAAPTMESRQCHAQQVEVYCAMLCRQPTTSRSPYSCIPVASYSSVQLWYVDVYLLSGFTLQIVKVTALEVHPVSSQLVVRAIEQVCRVPLCLAQCILCPTNRSRRDFGSIEALGLCHRIHFLRCSIDMALLPRSRPAFGWL